MKHLITLLVVHALACCTAAQTVGQWELRQRTSTGFTSYGITAENGKAIGFSAGVPAMLSISGGAGLDNVASTITGGTLTLAGTLTAGRTLTVRDLSGTIALTSDLSAYLTTSSASSIYEPILTAGTTSQYYRGDKSWQTLNATAVGLGNVTNALQLAAANNLSDLANAAAARVALGVEQVVAGVAQVLTVQINAPAQTSWAGEYVDIDDGVEVCRFWFTVNGSGSAPSAPSPGRLQVVAVNDGDSASAVETAFLAALASQSARFTSSGNTSGTITVTNITVGDAADPASTILDVAWSVTTPGSDSVRQLAAFDGSNITNVTAAGLALTLPIDGGGTGQTSQTAAFDALAPTTTKGDLIVSNGTDNVRLPVGATNGHVLTVDSAEAAGVKWAAASGGSATTDVKLYTANDTWTNPSPSTAKRFFVRLVGGGGGGGSGRKGAAGSVRTGGGGGGAAGVVEFWCLTTDFGSTVSVVVGAGGTGGASVTANSTSGNVGTAGGETTFASTRALGGAAGTAGGTSAAAAVAGKTCVEGISTATSPNSGGSSGTGSTGSAGSDANTSFVPTGGGGGGGITSGDVASTGGRGGTIGTSAGVLAVDGGALGAISTNGGTGNSTRGVGTGGGGGGSSTSGNAGSGGAGGGYGAGGGGGGASLDSVGNSGAGGNGAPGYALIITYL